MFHASRFAFLSFAWLAAVSVLAPVVQAQGSLADQFDPDVGGTIDLSDEPLQGDLNATFAPGVIGVPQPRTDGTSPAAIDAEIAYVNAQIETVLNQMRGASAQETRQLNDLLLSLTRRLIELEGQRDALAGRRD